MIVFSSISYFVSRLNALKDVKRGVYNTVEDEIRAAFKDCSIEQIRQNYDMILLDDPRSLLSCVCLIGSIVCRNVMVIG